MRAGQQLALAFGVFKTTDIAKEIFDRATGLTPRPYLKSLVATGLAVGAACAYEDGWRERVLTASAVAGMSAVLHEGYAMLSSGADRNKVVVVQQAARAAAGQVGRAARAGSRVPAL